MYWHLCQVWVQPRQDKELRKTISRRLVAVKNQTAMLTTFNEADMTDILFIRKKYKESFETKHKIGLGLMSFFVKACTIPFIDFPVVNSALDEEDIVFHEYCDISIA